MSLLTYPTRLVISSSGIFTNRETGVTVARLNLAQKEGFRLPRFLHLYLIIYNKRNL